MPGLSHPALKYGIKRGDIKKLAQRHPVLTLHRIEDLFQQILIEIYTLVLIDLKNWINRFVPKRTGQLRDNLIANLLSSRVKSNYLTIILLTSIAYADQVSKYKTSQVRHSHAKREHYTVTYVRKGRGKKKIGKGKVTTYHPYATANYYGKSGRIILHDPQAIGNFFKKLVKFAIVSILKNLKKVKRRYASRTKLTYRAMKIIKLW